MRRSKSWHPGRYHGSDARRLVGWRTRLWIPFRHPWQEEVYHDRCHYLVYWFHDHLRLTKHWNAVRSTAISPSQLLLTSITVSLAASSTALLLVSNLLRFLCTSLRLRHQQDVVDWSLCNSGPSPGVSLFFTTSHTALPSSAKITLLATRRLSSAFRGVFRCFQLFSSSSR